MKLRIIAAAATVTLLTAAPLFAQEAAKQSGRRLTLDAAVPVGANATVELPAQNSWAVTEGGVAVGDADGVRAVSHRDGTVSVKVGSGHYTFVVDERRGLAGAAIDRSVNVGLALRPDLIQASHGPTPAARTRSRTSPSPGIGRGTSSTIRESRPPNWWMTSRSPATSGPMSKPHGRHEPGPPRSSSARTRRPCGPHTTSWTGSG